MNTSIHTHTHTHTHTSIGISIAECVQSQYHILGECKAQDCHDNQCWDSSEMIWRSSLHFNAVLLEGRQLIKGFEYDDNIHTLYRNINRPNSYYTLHITARCFFLINDACNCTIMMLNSTFKSWGIMVNKLDIGYSEGKHPSWMNKDLLYTKLQRKKKKALDQRRQKVKH